MHVNDVVSSSSFELSELHFAELEGPTNIYGITTIEQVIDIRPARCPLSSSKPMNLHTEPSTAVDDPTNGLLKPMIFAMSGKGADNEHARNAVVHLQATYSSRGEVFSRKPVLLSDMPTDFNLISVAALRTNDTQEHSILLALSATVKASPPTAEDTFIMIYKITNVSGSTIVPHRLRRISLSFIPFTLDTISWNDGKDKQGFVVSGQNRLLYFSLDELEAVPQPSPVPPHINILEQADGANDLLTLLPEIGSPFRSCVTAFVIRYFGGTRVSVFACQDGRCHLTTTAVEGDVSTSEFVKFDGPISSVDLFETKTKDRSFLHLIVGCTVEAAIIYSDVIGHGLNRAQSLPGSQDFDSVLCVKAIHMNFAPHMELFVGTYGQKLLVYQLDPEASDKSFQFPVFRMKSQQSFAHPIYRVLSYDLTNDGMTELVVLSMLGLHVFQRNSQKVIEHISHLAQQMQRLVLLQRQLEAKEATI